MSLHNVAVNLRDRVPTVVAEQEKKKSDSKRLLKLSRIGSLPEIKDDDCDVSGVSMACGSERSALRFGP